MEEKTLNTEKSGQKQRTPIISKQQLAPQPSRRECAKVGRNEPCPCGSGKKFKTCCYDKAAYQKYR